MKASAALILLLFGVSYSVKTEAQTDTTYCIPTQAECERVDSYLNGVKISTSIYYGVKVTGPPPSQM